MRDFNRQLTEYRLDAELAHTLFATTFQAHRIADNAPMLLLVVSPDFKRDAYFNRRFKEILQRNIQIEHPNILPVIPSVDVENLPFMAMRIPENGMLLERYLETQTKFAVSDALSLIRQLGTALDFAHGQGMRHGDLSGENIFIVDEQLSIFGFGMTQLYEDSTQKSVPPIADVRYLSPSRLQGESPSRTADLYALGVWSYRLLTGEFPQSFNAETRKYTVPVAPHQLNPNVRPAISEVVLRMLSRGVELRHNTGAEFIRALQVASEGSTPIRPITAANIPIKRKETSSENSFTMRGFAFRQYFVRILVLVVIAVGALLGGYWLINQFGIFNTEEDAKSDISTPIATQTPLPAPIIIAPTPTKTLSPPTPTPTALSTPTTVAVIGETIAPDSPFSQLQFAQDISDDYRAVGPAFTFSSDVKKIYLFFHYQGIQVDTPWGVEWRQGTSVIELGNDKWSADYGSAGTAWVFYAPIDGFEAGNYSVVLSVEGSVVASASFTITAP